MPRENPWRLGAAVFAAALLLGAAAVGLVYLAARPAPPRAPARAPRPAPPKAARGGRPAGLPDDARELLGEALADVRRRLGPPSGVDADALGGAWYYRWEEPSGRWGLVLYVGRGRVVKVEGPRRDGGRD